MGVGPIWGNCSLALLPLYPLLFKIIDRDGMFQTARWLIIIHRSGGERWWICYSSPVGYPAPNSSCFLRNEENLARETQKMPGGE